MQESDDRMWLWDEDTGQWVPSPLQQRMNARKEADKPWHEKVWVRVVAVAVALVLVIGVVGAIVGGDEETEDDGAIGDSVIVTTTTEQATTTQAPTTTAAPTTTRAPTTTQAPTTTEVPTTLPPVEVPGFDPNDRVMDEGECVAAEFAWNQFVADGSIPAQDADFWEGCDIEPTYTEQVCEIAAGYNTGEALVVDFLLEFGPEVSPEAIGGWLGAHMFSGCRAEAERLGLA